MGVLLPQVIAPVMGWVRNYHGYQFFDRTDGAAWGPEDSNAIDMMHMAMNGFDFLDDRKTRLAEVLQVHLPPPPICILDSSAREACFNQDPLNLA